MYELEDLDSITYSECYDTNNSNHTTDMGFMSESLGSVVKIAAFGLIGYGLYNAYEIIDNMSPYFDVKNEISQAYEDQILSSDEAQTILAKAQTALANVQYLEDESMISHIAEHVQDVGGNTIDPGLGFFPEMIAKVTKYFEVQNEAFESGSFWQDVVSTAKKYLATREVTYTEIEQELIQSLKDLTPK